MKTAYSQKLPRTFSGLIFYLRIERLPKVITNQRLFRSIVFTSDRFNRTSPSLKNAIAKRETKEHKQHLSQPFVECGNQMQKFEEFVILGTSIKVNSPYNSIVYHYSF